MDDDDGTAENEGHGNEMNLLAMQMQRFQYHSTPSIAELWTIWSLVDSMCYNINGRDNLGVPPIVYAAKRGSTLLLRLLLNYHADINAMSTFRETAVMAACRRQKIGAVKFLIKRGARLDLVDRSRFSALRWVATLGDVPLVRLLLKHKVSVTNDCYTANSALEIAMAQPTKRHLTVVLLLQRQLVVERRQLLQEVVARKEKDEIDTIKKHRRKMRRLQARKREDEAPAASIESAPLPLEPTNTTTPSPFALPVIPSLNKTSRGNGATKTDPQQAARSRGFGNSTPDRPSSRETASSMVTQNRLLPFESLLQTQFAPPMMEWVKAGRGRWHQQEVRPHAPLSATAFAEEQSAVTISSAKTRENVLQLYTSESAWSAFLKEPSPPISRHGKPSKSCKGLEDSTNWHVEDLE